MFRCVLARHRITPSYIHSISFKSNFAHREGFFFFWSQKLNIHPIYRKGTFPTKVPRKDSDPVSSAAFPLDHMGSILISSLVETYLRGSSWQWGRGSLWMGLSPRVCWATHAQWDKVQRWDGGNYKNDKKNSTGNWNSKTSCKTWNS